MLGALGSCLFTFKLILRSWILHKPSDMIILIVKIKLKPVSN
jgi:hypothetical protein